MIVGTSLVLMSAHNLCFVLVAKITKTAFPSIPQFLHRGSRVIHYTDVCTDVFLMAVWSNTDSDLKFTSLTAQLDHPLTNYQCSIKY